MICEKLKALLRYRNISQPDFAKRINASELTINLKLNGKLEFSLTEILNILKVTGKTFEELFIEEER